MGKRGKKANKKSDIEADIMANIKSNIKADIKTEEIENFVVRGIKHPNIGDYLSLILFAIIIYWLRDYYIVVIIMVIFVISYVHYFFLNYNGNGNNMVISKTGIKKNEFKSDHFYAWADIEKICFKHILQSRSSYIRMRIVFKDPEKNKIWEFNDTDLSNYNIKPKIFYEKLKKYKPDIPIEYDGKFWLT